MKILKHGFIVSMLSLLSSFSYADWRDGMIRDLEEDNTELGQLLFPLMKSEYENTIDLYLIHRRVDFLNLYKYETKILSDLKKEHFENISRMDDLRESLKSEAKNVNLSFANTLANFAFLVNAEKQILSKINEHLTRISFLLQSWKDQTKPEILTQIKKNREPLDYFPRPFIAPNRARNGIYFNLSYTYTQTNPKDPHHVMGSGVTTSSEYTNLFSQVLQMVVNNFYYQTNGGDSNSEGYSAVIAALVTTLVTGYQQEAFEKKLEGARKDIEETFDNSREALDKVALELIKNRTEVALQEKTDFDLQFYLSQLLSSAQELKQHTESSLAEAKKFSERELTMLYEDLKKRINIPTEIIVNRYFEALHKTHKILEKYYKDSRELSLKMSQSENSKDESLDAIYEKTLMAVREDARIVDTYLDTSSYSNVQDNPFLDETLSKYPISSWTAFLKSLQVQMQKKLFEGAR
ncbi:MAG: hypothetical protein KA116_04410 [Proteobacteria bacterium]|nr:hypothetical protein [Pseudomonadota bacterium]